VLEALPKDLFDYRPHDRSPSARELVWTLASETRACCDLVDSGRLDAAPTPSRRRHADLVGLSTKLQGSERAGGDGRSGSVATSGAVPDRGQADAGASPRPIPLVPLFRCDSSPGTTEHLHSPDRRQGTLYFTYRPATIRANSTHEPRLTWLFPTRSAGTASFVSSVRGAWAWSTKLATRSWTARWRSR